MSFAYNVRVIKALVRQEIIIRHKGTIAGSAWNWMMPLCLLAVYAFVFGKILKVKWPGFASSSTLDFTIALFTGLIVMNLFSDVVSRSSTLIASNANLIKKISFPIHLLPAGLVGAALNTCVISMVFLVGLLLYSGVQPTFAWLFVPIILLGVLLQAIGAAWVVSACSAFLKDLALIIQPVLTALLFLTPVFYPLASLPKEWHWLVLVNPLTQPIEMLRSILIQGAAPSVEQLAWSVVTSTFIALFGFFVFNRLKEGFADVI